MAGITKKDVVDQIVAYFKTKKHGSAQMFLIEEMKVFRRLFESSKEISILTVFRELLKLCQEDFDENFDDEGFDGMKKRLLKINKKDLKNPRSLRLIEYLEDYDFDADDVIRTLIEFILKETEEGSDIEIQGVGKLS